MINANFEVELDIANILKAFSNLENQVFLSVFFLKR